MLACHAPPSLINTLHFHSFTTFSIRRLSLFPATKLLCFHNFQVPARTLTAMAGANSSTSGDQSSDHVPGNWYSVPDLRLRDHHFTVPLDYSLNLRTSPKISIFAREIVAVGKEEQPLPYLLYLQGGPGFECQRPTEASGWMHKACEEFRVVLMDQRGTGLSTPLTSSSMLQLKAAESLADYLKYFRADNIVKDAEFIRVRLVPDAGPWTILGQSYGGFCAVTYLSFAPEGLRHVLLTGGIPPIGNGCTADAVYKACFGQIINQNDKYYKRYPQDIEIVRELVKYLSESEGGGVALPSGGILTSRGLQTLGLSCLGSSNGFERLHYMLETIWDPVIIPGSPKRISNNFLNAGTSSLWSAQRIRTEYEEKFDAIRAAKQGDPVYFTGEMIFPWMFDEIHALKQFKDAAHILAEKQDWPSLYDTTVLNNNKVPVAAAVYYDDMFVNFKLAMETASQIAGIRLWITNEYMHSGLRDAGTRVFDQLMAMLNGKKPLF
ncbi:uncharacterized protein LOC107432885 isoform X2 [Ziziphus jujuba]|uniref:Uncharacterized protein LOC107432885 isoform X2 n=1 Tax=Ziziphus jujuba TaxID=326968 RepID=A0ABM3ZVL7_ZIZJJ|nr:uncharacterized protein LOC107432885 isoform X2 [Ziziphus jujuba]